MGLNYFASSSPAMVLTPNQNHQSFPFGNSYLDHNVGAMPIDEASSSSSTNMTDPCATSAVPGPPPPRRQDSFRKSIRPRFPRPPSLNYLARTDSIASGRKRSFADAVDDPAELAADGSEITQVSPASAQKSRGEPIYGPGMTLIYPDDPGFAIAAESQTGTWAEEKNERAEIEAAAVAERPVIASRKSQRRLDSDGASIDLTTSMSTLSQGNALNSIDVSPTTVDQPDALALTLGVGWKRISPTLEPATKGWEKYIANHYDNVLDPVILLHSEGHHAYLVRSKRVDLDGVECYWVFQEDLSVCRPVGLTESQAVHCLQNNETVGPAVEASKVPRRKSQGQTDVQTPSALQNAVTTTWAAPDAFEFVPGGHADVEMET